MLEHLADLIKQSSQEAVVNNPEIPNDQNNAVMQEAGASVMETLQSMMAGGQAPQVMNLFSSNAEDIDNNPVTHQVQQNLTQNLSSKFNMPPGAVKALAALVVPLILSKLVRRANDSNDSSFGIQDIFNTLSGGGSAGLNIPNILSRFTQHQGAQTAQATPAGSSGFGLDDLIGSFTGRNQQQNQQSGGFLDQLKRLI